MKIIKYIITFIRKSLDDNVMVYAAQSAYYLMLSSIPFIMILLSIVQFFIPLSSEGIMRIASTILPANFHSLVKYMLDEIFSKPTFSLISFSAITTLWSASRGFAAMERGIRVIYRLPKRNNLILNILISFIYTITFTLILLFFLFVIVFGRTIVRFIKNHATWLLIDINIFQYLFFVILAVLFFTAIYAGLSSRKIPLRKHLPGALFTVLGWVLFSFIFSIYINNIANYSRIYGSLTAIVLMMLWLYSCMTILLFGAEINRELLQYEKRKDF